MSAQLEYLQDNELSAKRPVHTPLLHVWRATRPLASDQHKGKVMTGTTIERKLTQADIEAIVDLLEARALARFQAQVTRGVLSLVGTWLVRALVVLAVYGAGSSGLIKKITQALL
jgi:hypothetical protein